MAQQPKPPQQPSPPPRPGPGGPSQPAGTPQTQMHPNPQPPGGGQDYEQSRHQMGGEGQQEHDTRPQHPSGEIHPDTPSVGAPPAKSGDDPAKALEKKREEEWKESDEEEEEAEKDFKLPKIGARDYVAGQPVDDKELQDTIKENKQRKETGRKAFKEGHTPDRTHSAWVEQYGQPTGSGGGPGQSKGQPQPTGVGVKAE